MGYLEGPPTAASTASAQDRQEAALRWLLKAVEQGHCKAQFEAGRLYAMGNGVPKDNDAAIKRFRKAADQGHAVTQGFPAVSIQQDGPGQDLEAVAHWFRKAAEEGQALEQFPSATATTPAWASRRTTRWRCAGTARPRTRATCARGTRPAAATSRARAPVAISRPPRGPSRRPPTRATLPRRTAWAPASAPASACSRT